MMAAFMSYGPVPEGRVWRKVHFRRTPAFGLICVRTGYPVAFALTGALILAAVPAARREQRPRPGRRDHVVMPPGGSSP
jgi:hypothetical protein